MTEPTPDVIIWDFDGTIADTQSVIVDSFLGALAEAGHDPCEPENVRAVIGLPLGEAFAHIVDGARAGPDEQALLVATYRRIFAQLADRDLRMFPGIAEILGACSGAGVSQAIATGRGRPSLDDLLAMFSINRLFSTTVTPEDVVHAKPHPDMVELVCARLGVDPGRALMIGDASFDIEMGRRAGARTCAVTWGNQSAAALGALEPDHMVTTVDELADLLGI